jgi:hypothetical protein
MKNLKQNCIDLSKAKQKFYMHRWHAKNERNIEFLLTFEEWYDIWQKSGHWENRGRKKGQYVMSRYNDIGPYSKDNVFIQTCTENLNEKKGKTIIPNIGTANAMKMRWQDPIFRNKMSLIHKNKKVSDNTKRKISQTKQLRKLQNG